MPLFRLPREPIFPDPELAEPDGLLAVGGDLSVERLRAAYADDPGWWFRPIQNDPKFVRLVGRS